MVEETIMLVVGVEREEGVDVEEDEGVAGEEEAPERRRYTLMDWRDPDVFLPSSTVLAWLSKCCLQSCQCASAASTNKAECFRVKQDWYSKYHSTTSSGLT